MAKKKGGVLSILGQADALSDGDLQWLIRSMLKALKARRRRRNEAALVALRKGDRVEVVGGRKANGRRGEVVKVNKTKCVVRLGRADGILSEHWTIPGSMLRKVEVAK